MSQTCLQRISHYRCKTSQKIYTEKRMTDYVFSITLILTNNNKNTEIHNSLRKRRKKNTNTVILIFSLPKGFMSFYLECEQMDSWIWSMEEIDVLLMNSKQSAMASALKVLFLSKDDTLLLSNWPLFLSSLMKKLLLLLLPLFLLNPLFLKQNTFFSTWRTWACDSFSMSNSLMKNLSLLRSRWK